jgi:hypothetical protein
MDNIKKDFFSIKNFNVITQTLNEYMIIKNRNKLTKNDYIEIYNLMSKNYDINKDIKTLNKIIIQKYLQKKSEKKSINTFQYNDIQKINKNINEKNNNLKLKNENEIITDLYGKKEQEVYEKTILQLKTEDELVISKEEIQPMYSNEDLKNYTLVDYIQSKPDEKFRRIDNNLLIIDSRERDNYLTTNSNSYRIKLYKPFKNIEEIELLSAEIPITKYNINDINNSFTFNIGISSYDLTLTNGLYDVIDINNELGTLISNTLTVDGVSNNFVVDYDTVQNKFIFTNEILSNPNYTTNLIGWYPATLNTTNGTEILNIGISSYITGILTADAVVTTITYAFEDRSYYFDGTDDRIQLETDYIFNTTDQFTFCTYLLIDHTKVICFFAGNNTVSTQNFGYINNPKASTIRDGICMRYGSSAYRVFVATTAITVSEYKIVNEHLEDVIIGTTHTYSNSVPIPWLDSDFHHHAFAFQKDGTGNIDYYFDGIYATTIRILNQSFTYKSFGSGYSSNLFAYLGYMDDIRIYDTALTASSVSQIYQETAVNAGGDPADYQFNLGFTSTTGIAKNLGFISTSVTSSIYTDYPATSITRLSLYNTHALISDIPATLSGEPFMVLDIKNLKAELVSNNEKFEEKFAKIPLTKNLYSIENYNAEKNKAKKIFNPPLASIDYLDIEFLDSDGNLYDFNGHENALSLNFKINEYQLPLHISSNELNQS